MEKQRRRLKLELKVAVEREDYGLAACLRDELLSPTPRTPSSSWSPSSSARWRRELPGGLRLARPTGGALPFAQVNSTASRGVRVKVSSYYVPSRPPHLGQFFFTYKVHIARV